MRRKKNEDGYTMKSLAKVSSFRLFYDLSDGSLINLGVSHGTKISPPNIFFMEQ